MQLNEDWASQHMATHSDSCAAVAELTLPWFNEAVVLASHTNKQPFDAFCELIINARLIATHRAVCEVEGRDASPRERHRSTSCSWIVPRIHDSPQSHSREAQLHKEKALCAVHCN